MADNLRQFIAEKRKWSEPLSDADAKKGFKGWYASKHLPHFDSPGTQQFITYRLADSMPAARLSEWEVFLHLEDKLEKQRKIEAYLDRGYGECSLRDVRIAQLVQENLWHHDGVKYRLRACAFLERRALHREQPGESETRTGAGRLGMEQLALPQQAGAVV